ncbi:MAG: trypsin-like peptidase domain-containing protein [Verrucomicrobia bacterium]|nr:trypsin-like peptidase domain-containing protein [Verrucomicrobiota bacterium]MCH8511087.1 serine protease [Kiritimatiellia bacterium]
MNSLHLFKSALIILLCILPVLTRALEREDVERIKMATAYVVVGEERSATAFSIAPGLFATSHHVFKGRESSPIHLVLHANTENEFRVSARVVRQDAEADLAILKIDLEDNPAPPALQLGDVADLYETQPMIAFGFPFGSMLSLQNQNYPSVSVNMGRITSLGMQAGILQRIQLDAQLNPGNSGGPVLDEQGRVVGIVSSGVAGAGVNFATPVSKLHPLLEAPDVDLDLPSLNIRSLHEHAEIRVGLTWILEAPDDLELKFLLEGGPEPQTYFLTPGDDGTYRASFVPIQESEGEPSPTLRVRISYPNGGELRGLSHDRDLQLGDEQVSLKQVRRIVVKDEVEVVRRDAQAWRGKPPAFEPLEIFLGEERILIRPELSSQIQISPIPEEIPGLSYRLTLLKGGEPLHEVSGMWSVDPESDPQPDMAMKLDELPSPTVTGVREIQLPSPVRALDIAGDGRYLLLHLPEVRRLARFDNAELRITGYLNLAENEVLFAGGSTHILVYYANANLLARYSLETLERERTITNPLGELNGIAMGFSSGRHAMLMETGIHSRSHPHIFDVQRMRALEQERGQNQAMSLGTQNILHASANGRVYGSVRSGGSQSGFSILQFQNGKLTTHHGSHSWGAILPGPDGREIYTTTGGAYTVNLVPLVPLRSQHGNYLEVFLPSYDSTYFISLPRTDSHRRDAANQRVNIFMRGQETPLVTLNDPFEEMKFSERASSVSGTTSPLRVEDRFHFIPQLNLFLTLPDSDDRIFARSLVITEILDAKGIDYFHITSQPHSATPSSLFQYQLRAMSKADGVRFHLETGPEGLEISTGGLVQWQTPESLKEESVIVRATNAIGQEILHTFRIPVSE